ncbi:hypothetical protein GALL_530410 [mine drainage metagenome]|uniref:Uncharacterized protein n=1 Tax=mine drainage metagenome TaxID=410659 RepID=A0A1J5P3Y7_9ZZZZ
MSTSTCSTNGRSGPRAKPWVWRSWPWNRGIVELEPSSRPSPGALQVRNRTSPNPEGIERSGRFPAFCPFSGVHPWPHPSAATSSTSCLSWSWPTTTGAAWTGGCGSSKSSAGWCATTACGRPSSFSSGMWIPSSTRISGIGRISATSRRPWTPAWTGNSSRRWCTRSAARAASPWPRPSTRPAWSCVWIWGWTSSSSPART